MSTDSRPVFIRYKQHEVNTDWKHKTVEVAAFLHSIISGFKWTQSYESAKSYDEIDEEDLEEEFYEDILEKTESLISLRAIVQ